jgi:hypothetical protein
MTNDAIRARLRERFASSIDAVTAGPNWDTNAAAVAARLALVNQAHALEDDGDYLGAAVIYDGLAARPDLRAFTASVVGFRSAAERARIRAKGV